MAFVITDQVAESNGNVRTPSETSEIAVSIRIVRSWPKILTNLTDCRNSPFIENSLNHQLPSDCRIVLKFDASSVG